ncbi:fumarylacetoacetate hydrolase family protein [Parafrankia elaeagni]|uniref:fumarylacetoacetate hydrolase family protein n=1 Tax=Parafrankia elaeagni TaxID=222534 RepID=UPI000381CF02|nr:fumarylacetoacetate hydrolase family protein [Parafrankia elaeagni]
MHIGRFASADGTTWFWGLVDLSADTARRIVGPLHEWAAQAAAEQTPPLTGADLPLATLRLLAPLAPGARVLGVGANYRAHLARFGVEPPKHPAAFIKPDSAIVDPGGEISYPATTSQLDYEVELVVIPTGRAGEPVLGYTIGNDVSARDAKNLGGLDLFGMKALDATSPVGPWISTPAELGAGRQPEVELSLRVNGELRQRDNTGQMIWSVEEVLRYLDDRVALRSGDVVFTGTTAGVGLEDGRFLEPGDVVEAEIAGIGVLRNTVGKRS